MISADSAYNGFNPPDITVVNIDDEIQGITVTPTSGLETTEAGGTASFTVVLTFLPTADVTVALSSTDMTEGTVSPASVTFTAANGKVPQTVTVTGVDDQIDDDDVVYSIVTAPAVSGDAKYNGLYAADVAVTNHDDPNDTAGITVTATAELVTTEAGGTASFSVVLNTQPLSDVVIGLSTSDPTEGFVAITSVTFTDLNWNVPPTGTQYDQRGAAATWVSLGFGPHRPPGVAGSPSRGPQTGSVALRPSAGGFVL